MVLLCMNCLVVLLHVGWGELCAFPPEEVYDVSVIDAFVTSILCHLYHRPLNP